MIRTKSELSVVKLSAKPWDPGSVRYSFNRAISIRSWSIEMWINKIPECGPRILEIPKNNNLTILAMYRGLMYMIYS